MKRVAIAVAEDGESICRKMLGRAARYISVDLDEAGRVVHRSERINPYQDTLQRGKTFDVADLLADCQVLICRRIGRRGVPRLRDRGFELVFTTREWAEEALADYQIQQIAQGGE